MLLALALSAASAGTLQQRYEDLRPQLASSPFGLPLHMESSERDGHVAGAVLAVVNHAFPGIASALRGSSAWCEVLILHVNFSGCEVVGADGAAEKIRLKMSRKGSDPDADTHEIKFRFVQVESSAGRFLVRLTAARGPLGTHDYRLEFEAAPLEAARSAKSLVRLSYGYGFGGAAQLAMSTYLQTAGKDKVGFTVTGRDAKGAPEYVGGLRGVLERNTMRYYLAVDSFLRSGSQPRAVRKSWRFNAWFDATERYRRQLHELTKQEYLRSKQSRGLATVSD